MALELSVIICTHNRYDVLNDAIASVELQDCPADLYELIIVDNSTDLDAQSTFVKNLNISCQHRLIVEPIPGLSRARNIGVNAAAASIVAFMDDDAEATQRWAKQIIETMRTHPEAAIAGGPVRPIWPSPRPVWLHKWLEGYLSIVDRGSQLRILREDEWLAGTNIIFRRDVLISAGLFSENLGRIGQLLLSNEELSISRTITAMGYETIYDPQIEMLHKVHPDRLNQAWMRRRVFWQVISELFSPGASREVFDQEVTRILDFQMQLPPKDRGIGGLFLDVDSPDLFHRQTEALATLVRLLAVDGRDWRNFLETKIS
jgi:glycosyltransferase involved in cell wall biosynthesis